MDGRRAVRGCSRGFADAFAAIRRSCCVDHANVTSLRHPVSDADDSRASVARSRNAAPAPTIDFVPTPLGGRLLAEIVGSDEPEHEPAVSAFLARTRDAGGVPRAGRARQADHLPLARRARVAARQGGTVLTNCRRHYSGAFWRMPVQLDGSSRAPLGRLRRQRREAAERARRQAEAEPDHPR